MISYSNLSFLILNRFKKKKLYKIGLLFDSSSQKTLLSLLIFMLYKLCHHKPLCMY